MTRRTVLMALAALAMLAAACGATVSSPSPSLLPSPTPFPLTVTTPEQAIARVIDVEPRLAGIQPRNPDLIGQASWYEVTPASGVGAFVVTVRIGSGDCPSGCIDEHRWTYAVVPDGTVTVLAQDGGPVPDGAWPKPAAVGRTGIGGTATAGPVCPVEKVPPDPACDPRPVAGAVVVIQDVSGAEVARVTTDADGRYVAEVAPGGYVVVAQDVAGLMGKPGPQPATVNAGTTVTVDLAYDTGIR